MNYNYTYKITIKLNEPFDINFINNFCNQHPNDKVLVEVQNTKGISSSMIRRVNPNVAIRIAGGYDDNRISRYGKDLDWDEDYYKEAVIYTRNETIKILEEIENIESHLNPNWSEIQKLLYIYERLKRGIMYDPKFEYKLSSEIRSLRGLITKQTVCAGYAMILKEFMDRNNISCEYVEGHTKIDSNGQRSGGHAWNIVNIGDKKYPIDLTWDNTAFRSGKSDSLDWLGKDISTFSKCHYPAPGEKTHDYIHTLSQINPKIIKRLYLQMGIGREMDYRTTTYNVKRSDGSKYIVAQAGYSKFGKTTYYRYYYADISADGKKQKPLILYSPTNITDFINRKKFKRPIPPNYESAIGNILFSKENISDSLSKRTFFIGKINKGTDDENPDLVTSYKEIGKSQDEIKLFNIPTKRYRRSDGSEFIAQQMSTTSCNNIDVTRYDIFEMVKENGTEVLKRNTVYTERNFFNDKRQSMVDDYLSRERLDRKVGEAGGYIGYYDANGMRVYNPDLVKYFETSKKIDIDSLNMQNQQTNTPTIQIPTFNELKSLALKYEIYIDSDDIFQANSSKFKIRDIKTKEIITDKSIISKAMFANIWLTSAGVKWGTQESRAGETYAFNDMAEKFYGIVCNEILDSCKKKGFIDTVDILKNINDKSDYKYNEEIIVNIFRTPYQTELINELFLNSLSINQSKQKPEPLYNLGYAQSLINKHNNVNINRR